MSMTEEQLNLAAVDKRIHQVIRASSVRHGWVAVEDHTPFEELVSREAADPQASEETRIRQEAFNALLGWLFGERGTPHPAVVLKRLYTAAYVMRRDLIAFMNMADLGLILGDDKQCQSYRLKVIFKGTKIRSRAQKRAGASAVYSQAQQGNHSRRKGERRKQREADRN